ncbi:MAG TPA: pyridoxamine 5'-phosphate oxidase family protein [Gaiellaceae bacterium]|nr:pyridoxamine 5'-phosphate oxidase family protein [Gaiellaceae bacterium]
MPIRRGRRIASARIRASLERLLEASTLCAIATVSGSRAHVNTAYFAWSPSFRVVWLSDADARHSRNLAANPSAAVAVFDSNQRWGHPDRGVQLFGRARELGGAAQERAAELYTTRFPAYREDALGAYRWYELRPRAAKVFDEPELGAGVFVTARIDVEGSVTWERTDVYSGARTLEPYA